MHCFYLRAEDENGDRKQRTDVQDIVFLGDKIARAGGTISTTCANKFQVSHYHMLCLYDLVKDEDFEMLKRIGIKVLLLPWDENTDEQKEYFEACIEDGGNPLEDIC